MYKFCLPRLANEPEIAYFYEIIDTILNLHNYSKKEILELQNKTRQVKGGFEKRLFLEGEK